MVGRCSKMKGENHAEVPDDKDLDSLLEFYRQKRKFRGDKFVVKYAMRKFKNFLQEYDYKLEDVNADEAIEFANYLRQDVEESTGEAYYGQIKRFTDWYKSRGVFDYNPFEMANQRLEWNIKDTVKRKVPDSELREYIREIKDPFTLVIVITLLKTGIRGGELYNLDLRDINLDHPISEELPAVRPEIHQKPNSIYIDSAIEAGKKYNGAERNHSNKKKSTRILPIDDELVDTLVWYIAMQPPTDSPAKPLLRFNTRGVSHRATYTKIKNTFVEWAQEHGLRNNGDGLNVSPHWCRHWFTTKLRKSVDDDEVENGSADGYVKTLRGDSDEDTIDIYTHDWSDEDWIREAYVNNIPSLFNGLDDGHYAGVRSDRKLIQQ